MAAPSTVSAILTSHGCPWGGSLAAAARLTGDTGSFPWLTATLTSVPVRISARSCSTPAEKLPRSSVPAGSGHWVWKGEGLMATASCSPV